MFLALAIINHVSIVSFQVNPSVTIDDDHDEREGLLSAKPNMAHKAW